MTSSLRRCNTYFKVLESRIGANPIVNEFMVLSYISNTSVFQAEKVGASPTGTANLSQYSLTANLLPEAKHRRYVPKKMSLKGPKVLVLLRNEYVRVRLPLLQPTYGQVAKLKNAPSWVRRLVSCYARCDDHDDGITILNIMG